MGPDKRGIYGCLYSRQAGQGLAAREIQTAGIQRWRELRRRGRANGTPRPHPFSPEVHWRCTKSERRSSQHHSGQRGLLDETMDRYIAALYEIVTRGLNTNSYKFALWR